MKSTGKILCVGFHKTGLTSLFTALRILGFETIKGRQAYLGHISDDLGMSMLYQRNYNSLLSYLEPYEAIVDNPWNILYKEIDAQFNNSKYILTLRGEDSWIRSSKKYLDKRPATSFIREWIYGVTPVSGNEQVYLDRYRSHNQEVLAYFKDRPDDLLVMNIEDGDGWDKLCPFLKKAVIQLPFPHFNKNS